ncbi:MAG: hydroxyacylglutathione hydrolase [Verrucomicrobia bacterium]|nr:hydroxyacylglutathione hydrolase [Verrucomicrobiota bacterium]MCH8510205.1 hydroxyacylglutathione hydrolase [Kiritimatiellia bacterium]
MSHSPSPSVKILEIHPFASSNSVPWLLECLPLLEDNFGWLLTSPGGKTLVVDAPEAGPLLEAASRSGRTLSELWITHGHRDHTAGIAGLVRSTGCKVRAHPELEIPGADPLPDEGTVSFDGEAFTIMNTSGHSSLDLSFHAPGLGLCFCGDTLFTGGCGRLFTGEPERMWASLLRLRALPDDTLLCCGHDYAGDNFTFATRTFPEVQIFRDRLEEVENARRKGDFLMPTTVGMETRSNPMLMADHVRLAEALNLGGKPAAEVFAKIREMRNRL